MHLDPQEVFTRQLGVLPPSLTEKVPITVIGVGGIGSVIAIVLGKMGFQDIHLYDPDKVEVHNLSNQYYRTKDIDKYKVDAMREMLIEFGVKSVSVNRRCFKAGCSSTPIVVSCVDSMASRIEIYRTLIKDNMCQYYIDTRMGLQASLIFVLPKDRRDIWELYKKHHLYPSEEAFRGACTERAIMFTPMGMAEKAGKIIMQILRKERINIWSYYYDLNKLCETGIVELTEKIDKEELTA